MSAISNDDLPNKPRVGRNCRLPAINCILLAACLLLLPLRPAPTQEAAPAQTYMVPMRDGVRLATDVRLGSGAGPWPAILMRTPYGRKQAAGRKWEEYVTVLQDVRGRGDSEGKARPFFDDGWGEHEDGLDTVKWILAQPWCNGKIGTAGASAVGMTQNLLAGANPPGVLAQDIRVAGGDLYRDVYYPGGVFQENLVTSWLKLTQWPEDVLPLLLAHPLYDDLWRGVDSTRRIRELRVNIPAVHISGWFDLFTQGTLDSFVARSRIAPNQWLIMGPWPHGVTRTVGELTFPPNAAEMPKGGQAKLWFDRWLRGVDNGMSGVPHVQYYVMGACGEEGAPGNEWRSAEWWPPPARRTELFLGPDRRLVGRPPTGAGKLIYGYDPAHPAPTRGGANLFMAYGPMDQREVERRADVLVFSTPPLKEPVEVTGRVMVRLYAASSARDTAFTAKLCDVYPDGRSMLVADGILRAACRESFTRPSPLQPGKLYRLDIALGSTSIIFNRGHRIRVDISSSNHPRFAAHPNVWGEGKPVVARQNIYYGAAHPSAVILPVVIR